MRSAWSGVYASTKLSRPILHIQKSLSVATKLGSVVARPEGDKNCWIVWNVWSGHRICQFLSPSGLDRKSTRLNSSHQIISYAVFCLKKKKTKSDYYDLIKCGVAVCSAHDISELAFRGPVPSHHLCWTSERTSWKDVLPSTHTVTDSH